MSKRVGLLSGRKGARLVHTASALGVALVFGAMAFVGLGQNLLRAAGNTKMYLTPANASPGIGETINVAVRVDSGNQSINGAAARLTYNPSLLEFVSINDTGTAFGIGAEAKGGNGQVSIDRAQIGGTSGDKLLATVTFKTLAAGTANVVVGSDSQALSSEDSSNTLGNYVGSTYAIKAPDTPAPPTPTNPTNPTPPVTNNNPPASTPVRPATTGSTTSTPRANTGTTVAVTPQGSTAPANVPSDSTIQVSTPTTIQPADDTSDVSKVEYYLRGKLIATVTQPPFSYEVDTSKLRNGTYELTTKTFKSDGSIASARHTLNVANPLNLAQIALQAKHYWWLLAIIAILMVDVITTLYLRQKNGRSGGTLTDMLMPWRKHDDLDFATTGLTTGASFGQMSNDQPATPAPTPVSQPTAAPAPAADSKLERFTPTLPQAGQVVAPKSNSSDKQDPNDPYGLLPR